MPPRRQHRRASSERSVPPVAELRTHKSYSIEVLRRATETLSVFSHARPALTLAQIVQTVELPKTTVYRVLSSLVEQGFCEWDAERGQYSLGFELVRLADIRRRQSNVHDIALSVMRDIPLPSAGRRPARLD